MDAVMASEQQDSVAGSSSSALEKPVHATTDTTPAQNSHPLDAHPATSNGCGGSDTPTCPPMLSNNDRASSCSPNRAQGQQESSQKHTQPEKPDDIAQSAPTNVDVSLILTDPACKADKTGTPDMMLGQGSSSDDELNHGAPEWRLHSAAGSASLLHYAPVIGKAEAVTARPAGVP